MKSFVVNKNAWHYKLNAYTCKSEVLHSDYLVDKFIRSKDNLCSYMQLTTWSMIKICFIGALLAFLAAMSLLLAWVVVSAFITDPIGSLINTGLVLGILTVGITIVALGATYESYKRKKLNKVLYEGETETSLAKAKYKSWKTGVCVPVEFEE